MRITLFINARRVQFWLNAGWYKGEPFALFKVSLLESYYGDLDSNSWTIS